MAQGRTHREAGKCLSPGLLERFEQIRAHGALRMGLIDHIEQAAERQHTPKVAIVASPADYIASSGKPITAGDIDLNVRAMSMGKLHHAMMGTAAVAIATAAAIPGTLVNLAAGGGERDSVRFGHPSGTLKVGAAATQFDDEWIVEKVVMSADTPADLSSGPDQRNLRMTCIPSCCGPGNPARYPPVRHAESQASVQGE